VGGSSGSGKGFVGTGWSWLRIGTGGEGACEYGNELSVFHKMWGNFLISCKTG
jgi:hypothetical protein